MQEDDKINDEAEASGNLDFNINVKETTEESMKALEKNSGTKRPAKTAKDRKIRPVLQTQRGKA